MANTQSTVTLQNIADRILIRGDLKPVLQAGGFQNELICEIATDVMAAMCNTTAPFKWNEAVLPPFYTNSWQQDYALITTAGASVTNINWLTDGVAVQVNNSSTPKPWSWVEVGRRQGRSTATVMSNSFFAFPQFSVNWIQNNQLYYGTWGAAATGNATWGNNPQPNQVITNPLSNGNSQPENPILQIQDSNGNLLIVTTYGTTGATPPSAASGAAPGVTVTDGSVVWTVLDPQGQGIRLKPVPSQTGPVWQLTLMGQMKPARFVATTSLNQQTLYPLTDDYESTFRAGCIAQAYLYSPEEKQRAKGVDLWNRWTHSVEALSLQAAKQSSERERDLDRMVPACSILGAGAPRVGWVGSAWPYGNPVT